MLVSELWLVNLAALTHLPLPLLLIQPVIAPCPAIACGWDGWWGTR